MTFWIGLFLFAVLALTLMGWCIVRSGDDTQDGFFDDYIQELED